MDFAKKRKVDKECREFNKDWMSKYFSHKSARKQYVCCAMKNQKKFEEVSLSRRTVARRIEAMGENLTSQLKGHVLSFQLFSLALDESTDIDDTAQLLIFVRGISENFEITEELLSMESMKGTTTGKDYFECVQNAMHTMQLPWQKLSSVTTDGCPSLTGKKVGLLKRLGDHVAEVDCTRELIFLHCIIHQEVLCKSVLNMKHVVDPVVKVVNFIRARGLNHRQFIKLLEDCDSEHSDVLYHTAVRWLSLGKVLRRVWDLKKEILLFLEIKGKDAEHPQLRNSEWLADMAF
ncbi:general transcription factor II-I repeat domain-containing protein 2A-like [Ciona intestinalis]